MSQRSLPSLLGCLTLMSVGLNAFPAQAQSQESAASTDGTARSLFVEARGLAAAGVYGEACQKFEQSLKLKEGIGTRFNLADCREHLGQKAVAHELFLRAADNAHQAGQAERERAARDRAALLEPHLSLLTLEVEESAPDLIVLRDHASVERAAWGIAFWIEPGDHTIDAIAFGKKPWSTDIEATADGPPITVRVPKLEADSDQPLASSGDGPGLAPRGAAAPRPEPGASNRNIFAVGLAAVGVAGFVAGTVFGLDYQSANEHATAICPASVGCTDAQIASHGSFVGDARQARNLALASFGVGTVSLLAAAAYYLSGESAAPRSSWGAEPVVSADGSWAVRAQGSF